MTVSLKLVSVNVEHSRHLDTVLPFLKREQADVVTIQEVNPLDDVRFSEAIGAESHVYVPMGRELRDGVHTEWGVAMYSRLPVKHKVVRYYKGYPDQLPETDFDKPETNNFCNRVLAATDVEKDGLLFRIATTHFTWTPDGSASDGQRRDIRQLFAVLEEQGECVLTGDFNAPRGGEIFSMIASRYADNIPSGYKTSLDLVLHRAAKERRHEIETKMVDGLFSTPAYTVSDVRFVDGVSDHVAIVATISKS